MWNRSTLTRTHCPVPVRTRGNHSNRPGAFHFIRVGLDSLCWSGGAGTTMQRTVMKSKRRIEVDSPTYWYGKVKRDVSNRRRTNARGPQVNDKKHLPIPSPLSDDALAGSSTHNPFAAIMVVSWCCGVVVRRFCFFYAVVW